MQSKGCEDVLVSAVIPTRHRPQLLQRAIASALGQTYPRIEVIVVLDGPDPVTVDVLRRIGDQRLRFFCLPEGAGGNAARNKGIEEAAGEWIAFLDDDDEWLPEKIASQMAMIGKADGEIIFSATQFFCERSRILPKLFPSPGQDIGEYICCEIDALGRPKTFLQTSTWMIRRDYLLNHSFTSGLRCHQDADWLLRHCEGAVLGEVCAFRHVAGCVLQLQ